MKIRDKFRNFLKEYGHDMVYIRRDKRFRCVCYSERSGESSNPQCSRCFGTGYEVTIEKYTCRRTQAAVPETQIGARGLSEAGALHVKAYVYYLEHHSNPLSGDLILEVEWDPSTSLPSRIREKYEISVVESMLGVNGQIEFHQVYTRTDLKGAGDDAALTTS